MRAAPLLASTEKAGPIEWPSRKRFVKLRVSTKGMRIIDKLGIEQVLADIRKRGEKV